MIGWNEYRERYSELTFKEKKRLYESWYRLYPEQDGYSKNLHFILRCIDKVVKQIKRNNLSIVEYGGYDGSLATLIMQEYHINIKWINVEIIPHKAKEQLETCDYLEHVLENEIWIEKPNFYAYDIFLSSSTLEHISNEEIIQLFDYIRSQNIKYLILLVTTTPKGRNWNNSTSTHVLRTGSIGMKKMLSERGYKLKEEENYKNIKWCGFLEYTREGECLNV